MSLVLVMEFGFGFGDDGQMMMMWMRMVVDWRQKKGIAVLVMLLPLLFLVVHRPTIHPTFLSHLDDLSLIVVVAAAAAAVGAAVAAVNDDILTLP